MSDHEFLPPHPGSATHHAGTTRHHAGTYRRVLPVALARLYENAVDWEHLPHVHARSFGGVRCIDAGPWGWRAAVVDVSGRESMLELVLDRVCRRWITRITGGFGAGTEIWTHAFEVNARRVDIVVDFFVPEADDARRVAIGAAYARYYAGLYDEDVAMMTERQRQLERRIDGARDHERLLVLGARRTLTLPMDIVVGGRELVLAEVDGALAAFPRQCPHQLGPLDAVHLCGRVVSCPWHGDRFDVLTGANLSGRSCVLAHLPRIVETDTGEVHVIAAR